MRPGWLLGGHALRELEAIAHGVAPELVMQRRVYVPSSPPLLPPPAAAPDINHPRALLPAWQAEAEQLVEALGEHGRYDDRGQPADVPTAILLTRIRTLDELRGQLARRLDWSGMLDP